MSNIFQEAFEEALSNTLKGKCSGLSYSPFTATFNLRDMSSDDEDKLKDILVKQFQYLIVYGSRFRSGAFHLDFDDSMPLLAVESLIIRVVYNKFLSPDYLKYFLPYLNNFEYLVAREGDIKTIVSSNLISGKFTSVAIIDYVIVNTLLAKSSEELQNLFEPFLLVIDQRASYISLETIKRDVLVALNFCTLINPEVKFLRDLLLLS